MDSFDMLSAVGDEDTVTVEMFKSWATFSEQFEELERLRVVTYCDSPEFIHELFPDIGDLTEMEVVVEDVGDYRERLIDKPDLADSLERLRSEGTLVIYTCNHDVHSKLYLIDHTDGAATCLLGSPNLSKHAWGGKRISASCAPQRSGALSISSSNASITSIESTVKSS